MKPFFTIIIACYNVAPYVSECLDSVLNQPFQDWECLVGVETSLDQTEKIVQEYAVKDARIKMFTGPCSGSCSASRNTGMDMANGEYIIFLDGDDTIKENSLQRLHDKISSCPNADIYSCALQLCNGSKGKANHIIDNYPPDMKESMNGAEATLIAGRYRTIPDWYMQMTILRNVFIRKHHLRCIHGLRRQDWEFTPRAVYLAQHVVPLHEVFYNYRIQPTSIGSMEKSKITYLKDYAIIFHSLLDFHARESGKSDFPEQVSKYWGKYWLHKIIYLWFHKDSIMQIPRKLRSETLNILFSNGFENLSKLTCHLSFKNKITSYWIYIFVRYPILRIPVEIIFIIYSMLSEITRKN